jgi:hypothetical protein
VRGRSILCRLGIWMAAASWATSGLATERPLAFDMDPRFLTPPPGTSTIGDSHGDIAVSPAGEIYVSVQGGEHKGMQVYDAHGRYLRNVPNAPSDLHGFLIANAANGESNIYGAGLKGQEIVQLTLDGKAVLTIPAASIPDEYKTLQDGKLQLALTGVAVAPNGDIYAVDGYGRDFIHRFDKSGRYIGTFGGDGPPWNFKTCHKIAIDGRFTPVRLLCTDRAHNRIVQMDLDGHVLGVFGEGLRSPSALAVYHDELAVAEVSGRVTLLGRRGEVLASIGTNDNADEVKTNLVPPEKWQPNKFYAPHGITYDAAGNLLVTEWNQWGRVVRVNVRRR